MDVVREFQQGAVRLHVLHHAVDGELHDARMSEELARHGYKISPGTLYPMLHRMQTAGLLISRQVVVDGQLRLVNGANVGLKPATSEQPSTATAPPRG